jgi:glutaredoxin
MAKEFFLKHHVPYVEVNVAEDEAAQREMIKKSHQMGVPVLDIDGKIFVGFNRNEVAKALKLS